MNCEFLFDNFFNWWWWLVAVSRWAVEKRDAAGEGGEKREMEKDERTRINNKKRIKKVYLNEVN